MYIQINIYLLLRLSCLVYRKDPPIKLNIEALQLYNLQNDSILNFYQNRLNQQLQKV